MLLTVRGFCSFERERVLHSPPTHQSKQTSLAIGRRYTLAAPGTKGQTLSEALVLAQGLYDPLKERSLSGSGVIDYRKEGAKTKVGAAAFIALRRNTKELSASLACSPCWATSLC